MIMKKTVLAFVIVIVLVLALTGCRREEERPQTMHSSKTAVPQLSEKERAVNEAIHNLARRKDIGMSGLVGEAEKLFRTLPKEIELKKILRQFQRDVLAVPIKRQIGEKNEGTTWRCSCKSFLGFAHFATALGPLMVGPTPEFDDLEFDLRVWQRLEQEMAPPILRAMDVDMLG